eukprot:403335938
MLSESLLTSPMSYQNAMNNSSIIIMNSNNQSRVYDNQQQVQQSKMVQSQSFSAETQNMKLTQKYEQNQKVTLSQIILKNPKSLSDNNTKLSLVEKQIDFIDNLNSQKLNGLETVYLSNNNLSELDNLLQFPNIRSLSLSFNKILSIEELKKLKLLSQLENLRIEGNPIVNLFPNIRATIIYLLPQLKNLDGQQIKQSERQESEVIYKKQQAIIEMLFNLNLTVTMLEQIHRKIQIHDHLRNLGYILDQRIALDLNSVLKLCSPSNFENYHINTWFERTYIVNQNKLCDTFSKRSVDQTWDQKFSDYMMKLQQSIALKRQNLETILKSNQSTAIHTKQVSSFSNTPRDLNSLPQNQLYGILSPRIIQTEYSPLRTLKEFNNNNQENQLMGGTLNQNISFNLTSDNKSIKKVISTQGKNKNTIGSTQSKKRRKRTEKSLGDIQQMNLTKLLDVKENSFINIHDTTNLLADQTFSGLLLNDTNNFDPQPSKVNQITISPNSIINNKMPQQKSQSGQGSLFNNQKKPDQDLQFSLQMLDKVETLEQQLKQRDQANYDLQDKNKKLIDKIKEFQEQNRSNVEQAKDQIINLQKQLKSTLDDKEHFQEIQNSALQKHVKQLKVQKEINLKFAILHKFYKNRQVMQRLRGYNYRKAILLRQKSFKSLKRTFKPKIKQIKQKHNRSLLIKSFSALLFYKLERSKKEPLQKIQLQFSKKRFLKKWHKTYLKQTTLESKVKFFHIRWLILKKKIFLRSFQNSCLKQHRTEKCYTAVKNYQNAKVQYKVLHIWRMKFRDELLEQRVAKFKVLKTLKSMVKKSRDLNKMAVHKLRIKIKTKLRQIYRVMKQFTLMQKLNKQKVHQFRQKHVESLKQKIFYRFIAISFQFSRQRQRHEIVELQEQLIPLQNTFDDKNDQAQYLMNKCKELENNIQHFENKFDEDQLQQSLQAEQFSKEKSQLLYQIDHQSSLLQDQSLQINDLELQNQQLQEQLLRKLEDFKVKFTQSEQEINELQQKICDQQEQIEIMDSDKQLLVQTFQTETQKLLQQLCDKGKSQNYNEKHSQLQGTEYKQDTSMVEKEHNIKLLHQLKKAHKTIDEMRKLMLDAELKVQKAKEEIDDIKDNYNLEKEQLMTKHISDIKELSSLADKVKKENLELKKELKYLTEKVEKMLLQKYQNKLKHEEQNHEKQSQTGNNQINKDEDSQENDETYRYHQHSRNSNMPLAQQDNKPVKDQHKSKTKKLLRPDSAVKSSHQTERALRQDDKDRQIQHVNEEQYLQPRIIRTSRENSMNGGSCLKNNKNNSKQSDSSMQKDSFALRNTNDTSDNTLQQINYKQQSELNQSRCSNSNAKKSVRFEVSGTNSSNNHIYNQDYDKYPSKQYNN